MCSSTRGVVLKLLRWINLIHGKAKYGLYHQKPLISQVQKVFQTSYLGYHFTNLTFSITL